MKTWLLLTAAVLLGFGQAAAELPGDELHVYGPGGPHQAMQACAEIFTAKHGIEVEVIRAFPKELATRLPADGDIYFGGAEYMLEEFVDANPEVLDLSTVEMLHPRRIGIIVRKGNPLGIEGVGCLQEEDVDLLAVNLENMDELHALSGAARPGVRHLAYTGQDGVKAWLARPELDAWITYRSWHLALEKDADFIEIPDRKALRYTPVALTSRTDKRQAALLFLSFLKSPEAEAVFRRHGWF